ncbi:hypothetical protein C8T65DRAFT_294776 [Cerioporus squamosus]|nr:hypothetical protein C8T65DRAFT_294776 [Cerioporus squamosus]
MNDTFTAATTGQPLTIHTDRRISEDSPRSRAKTDQHDRLMSSYRRRRTMCTLLGRSPPRSPRVRSCCSPHAPFLLVADPRGQVAEIVEEPRVHGHKKTRCPRYQALSPAMTSSRKWSCIREMAAGRKSHHSASIWMRQLELPTGLIGGSPFSWLFLLSGPEMNERTGAGRRLNLTCHRLTRLRMTFAVQCRRSTLSTQYSVAGLPRNTRRHGRFIASSGSGALACTRASLE